MELSSRPTTGTYQEIWEALKANTERTVIVNCKPYQIETLIQAVKKIKSTENAARKRLDDPSLPHWGRLVVDADKQAGKVRFSLTYAMENFL